jgi:hypothetical protein
MFATICLSPFAADASFRFSFGEPGPLHPSFACFIPRNFILNGRDRNLPINKKTTYLFSAALPSQNLFSLFRA